MSWMSASYSVHCCHDSDGGETSLAPPKIEEEEAVGEAAMATTTRLGREEKMVADARRRTATSFGSKSSQQGGGRLWSAREHGGHTEPLPSFKYLRALNVQIRNQRLIPNRPGIVRRKERAEW